MTKEKPIKIIPGKGKHKTEQRVFARNIHETFCVEPKCAFKNKNAQQGVCNTTDTFNGSDDWQYIDDASAGAELHIKHLRAERKSQKMSDKNYIARLESEIECIWMNSIFYLDELIRHRRSVALLKISVNHLKSKVVKNLKRGGTSGTG